MIQKEDTRMIFAQSLQQLLQTKDFEKISASDIINNCSLSRSTYYRFFRDKYDLTNWIFESFVEELTTNLSERNISWEIQLEETLKYIFVHRLFFKKVLSYNGQNCFFDFFRKNSTERTLATVQKLFKTDKLTPYEDFLIDYATAGMITMIKEWIEKDFPQSPELLAQWLNALNPIMEFQNRN